jgi:pSer/pThr/pTyr-binding forkhead associated (FHA) protein
MLKLKFADGSRESIWLVDSVLTIGSSATNNLVITAADMKPLHAEILLQNDELTLKNLNPEYIVGINDKPVSQSQKLQVNDVISLGQTKLQIITPGSEPKAKVSTKAVADSEWALEIHASWAKQTRFPIKDHAIIGRDENCNITVPVSQLSRQHARLTPTGSFLLVKDLDSTNGTFLNGERITQGRAKPGDKLRFDVVTFDVVGPAVDANKTVVRQAAPAPAGSKPADAKPVTKQPSAPVVKASQSKTTSVTASHSASAGKKQKQDNPAKVSHAPATSQAAAGTGSGSGKLLLIIGAVIVIAIAAGSLLLIK